MKLTNGNQHLVSSTDRLCAQKDEKYGLIDTSDKVIIPFEHDYAIYSYYDCYKAGRDGYNETPYYLDLTGKKIDVSEVKTDDKTNTYIGEYYIYFETDKYYCIFKDGKTGLCDKNMNILLPVKYESVHKITDEIFIAKETETSEAVYIDANGNPVEYMNRYSDPRITKSEYIIGQDKETQNFGMADKSGNIIIPFEYSFIYELGNNMFVIKTHTGKTGIAEFGTGKKIKDTFEGLTLKIDSTTATAFNTEVEIDAAPVIRNGRTMLPARFIAENLGAEVSWDGEKQTVTISNKSGTSLEIIIGSDEAKVDNYRAYTTKLDAPAFIENGRTYTPVRLIAEFLGANVFWEQNTQTVKILKR